LDGVVFAENMTSNVRIVQSALRASRKNKKNKNKITKIILPILSTNNKLKNNQNFDLKKVKEVIFQMNLEDEKIVQKIRVSKIRVEKQKPKIKNEKGVIHEFGEYNDKLTRNLRLETIERSTFTISYKKAKEIISNQNIKTKENYYNLCDKDSKLSKEPEILFKKRFVNWIEYLNIKRIYYDSETCKKKVNEYLLIYPEMKKHHFNLSIISDELCKIDTSFPPSGLWIEYYSIKHLKDIIKITGRKKNLSDVL